jgi:multiple sugar transport system substrate-binding protein
MSKTKRVLIACVAALLACGVGATADPVTVHYTLWDSNQLPAYQKVADNFMARHPDIKIEITQLGWSDYWNNLQTSMVAGTAADVFTDHLAKYPEFAAKGQLTDIEPMVKADKVPTDIYLKGLADLWTRDGRRYGLPKDWDTIAVVYNKDLAQKLGITEKEMNSMTWNPVNGGTFETVLRKFALDKNGNNGLSPDFDPANVVRWGIAMDYSNFGAYGQQYWSSFAASTGWKFTDGMYARRYHYNDPRFVQTMQYFADLSRKKGLMTPYEALSSQNVGSTVLFTSQRIGMVLDGSWMIGFYGSNTEFKVGFARLPIGPVGRRSMFNGLADSIYIKTQHPRQAWEWVKYLGSPEAQDVVGSFGVVFPAIESGVQAALRTYKERGLDVSAFTAQALEKNGTFLFPITDHAAEINSIMQESFDSIFLGKAAAADALRVANQKVDALFK